jgi:hypothetical protein
MGPEPKKIYWIFWNRLCAKVRSSFVEHNRLDRTLLRIAAGLRWVIGSQKKYKVIIMVGERVLGSHPWDQRLDSAKQHGKISSGNLIHLADSVVLDLI